MSDLSRSLQSDRLADRDAATAETSRRGPQLAAELLDDLETQSGRTQARTLYAFAGAQLHQQAARLRDNRVTLQLTAPLSVALAELSRRSGMLCRIALRAPDREVTIDRVAATALESLDAICDAGAVRWQTGAYGLVNVVEGASIARPATYDGPLAARLVSMHCERRTDFETPVARAGFRIATAFEWPLNPMTLPSLQLRGVRAGDRDLSTSVQAGMSSDGNAEFSCVVDDLPPGATRFDRIDAEVLATFPSGFTDCAVDGPEAGHTIETPGFRVRFDQVGDQGYVLAVCSRGIAAAQLSQEMLSHAVSNVILGINADGDEALAKVRTIMSIRAPAERVADPELKLGIEFVRAGFGRPVAVRFRLAQGARLTVHALSFPPTARCP